MDASTPWGNVALVEGDADAPPTVVAEAGFRSRDSHASRLLALAEALLSAAGWARSSLDAYAATRGPGSFTGLRVGLGTVQGLSLSSGRPAFGLGTLEAMAELHGPAPAARVPLLDARRGEVYGAMYDPGGTPPRELVSPWIGPPETAIEIGGASAVLFGSGASLHAESLRAAGWRGEATPVAEGISGAAGRLAVFLVREGTPPGRGMSPLYLRPADAELRG